MTMELREETRRREEEREAMERRRRQFAGDVRTLAQRPEGKRFFRWLIDQGNIFADDFQPGQLGAYRAGLRSTAVRLWRVLGKEVPAETFLAIVAEKDDGASDRAAGNGEPETRGNDF